MKLTQLVAFIKRRNTSDFDSNLQFEIDARGCGIDLAELGAAKKVPGGFEWITPHGILFENKLNGKLRLSVDSVEKGLKQ